jgi:hypothetical protein
MITAQLQARINLLNSIDIVVHKVGYIHVKRRRYPAIRPLCKFRPNLACSFTNAFHQVLEMPAISIGDEGVVGMTFTEPVTLAPEDLEGKFQWASFRSGESRAKTRRYSKASIQEVGQDHRLHSVKVKKRRDG